MYTKRFLSVVTLETQIQLELPLLYQFNSGKTLPNHAAGWTML